LSHGHYQDDDTCQKSGLFVQWYKTMDNNWAPFFFLLKPIAVPSACPLVDKADPSKSKIRRGLPRVYYIF